MNKDWKKVEDVLMEGGVAMIPTDTIYGIVARALDKKAVGRVYSVRGRDEKKPCIILISDFDDLNKLGIKVNVLCDGIKALPFLRNNWPGKVSVILPCNLKKFEYLHRGTNTLAVRMIGSRNQHLLNLIKKVGPIIAPSANPQGLPPARNCSEARKYFGPVRSRSPQGDRSTRLLSGAASNGVDKNIDAYICYGTREGKPSTLVDLSKGKIEILRQGKIKIKHP